MLRREGVVHKVLNAKYHAQEAQIVAEAGRLDAVTIATNMAGRGTDIILGGRPEGRSAAHWQAEHDEVIALGGLEVIGTERHDGPADRQPAARALRPPRRPRRQPVLRVP